MSVIVGLIDQLAIGLYLIIGVGIVWYWNRWTSARYHLRATSFELERDFARYQAGGALTVLVLLAELGLVVFGVQQVVVPTMRDDQDTRQRLLNAAQTVVEDDGGVFVTPTRPAPQSGVSVVEPVDSSELGGVTNLDIAATPTPTPTPVGTIEPNAPEVSGCNTPNAFLQIPANGMRVFQQTPVIGTAFLPGDFQEYKLEIRGPGISEFSPIDTGTGEARELGALSQFNPAFFDEGTYQFRLMVFDTSATLQASCQVTIYISAPPATPTPIPTANPGG